MRARRRNTKKARGWSQFYTAAVFFFLFALFCSLLIYFFNYRKTKYKIEKTIHKIISPEESSGQKKKESKEESAIKYDEKDKESLDNIIKNRKNQKK